MAHSREHVRHHADRAKARARRKLKLWDIPNPSGVMVGIHAGVRGHCSCEMCRNGRRSNWSKGERRLTMQERKRLDAEREQREE